MLEPGEHKALNGHGEWPSPVSRSCASAQETSELSFPAVGFAVHAQLTGSWPVPRDAQRCFGWLCDAAVASFPFDTVSVVVPFLLLHWPQLILPWINRTK